MPLASLFGGTRAASAAATQVQEESPESSPEPTEFVTPDKRAETKARWRLGISCDDEEFQKKADEFAAMFDKEDDPQALINVLDKYFTEHEKALFLQSPYDSELGRLQRDYSRKYHRLLRTERFRNAKVATPAEAKVTKLTMLYFGLPVSPYDSRDVDREPPSDSEDEFVPEILDDKDSGALRWLNAYGKRTYGHGVDREASDPKYEDLYNKRHGTGRTTRTKDDGWYSHFKQDMAVLRGGAGSVDTLIGGTRDSSAEPTGPFWRLHGRRGQVVFHDLVSFRLAVDRLLGLRHRGGSDVILVVRDDASLRPMIDTKKFTTGTEGEDEIYNLYIQPRDPSTDRRTYYLTLPQLPYPKTSQWVPDKNDRRVLMVRRDGDTTGEVAYLNLVPFFNPLIPFNPELDSHQFTAYLCDVAKLLMPGATPDGESLVHRIVQVRAGNIKANSLGALNLTSELVQVLRHHVTGRARADLRISCPESDADAALKWRIYIPGVCMPDKHVSQFCFDLTKDEGVLADRLRELLGSVLGKDEYENIHHVEIFNPGEGMLRWNGEGKSVPCHIFNIHEPFTAFDECLEHRVAQISQVARKHPHDRAFIGVRPVFRGYTVLMRNSAGELPDLKKGERPSFEFAIPCRQWSGCTLAQCCQGE
ncbi:hypothetical protein MAPG_02966 [Magnaporthiopsis poae ATCC 64411]|uniref:Uncharacterized protein n=1 Tax=Magnaporthiopsis poae (strain ATCC 64411 / 73-15) TaxID=644358 RepID=A0A0C4DSS6_MAGP6|nr:hypothetical protein MAPG_02966 [Magnaporthiopsis poae ATCC 64411]